jgi:hypothetical protein
MKSEITLHIVVFFLVTLDVSPSNLSTYLSMKLKNLQMKPIMKIPSIKYNITKIELPPLSKLEVGDS